MNANTGSASNLPCVSARRCPQLALLPHGAGTHSQKYQLQGLYVSRALTFSEFLLQEAHTARLVHWRAWRSNSRVGVWILAAWTLWTLVGPFVCVCLCVRVCRCVCGCVGLCWGGCVYKRLLHIYIYIYIHTYIHTYIHIYIYRQRRASLCC
jgi:hypothetical protein